MKFMIPMVNLKDELNLLHGPIMKEIEDVLNSGIYILGPKGRLLEEKIADYTGTGHALGTANGTDALYLALRALEIGEGDEVITTPFTFFATGEAIAQARAVPVFANIDPVTYNIQPNEIKKKITAKTKAIIVVHLYGQAADMDAINEIAAEHGLYVIEDACQAIGTVYKGRKAGSIGHIGCFSFFPSKSLGAFGDAGMVVTSDKKLYDKMNVIRNHGSTKKYIHSEIGINSRLDEIHAAILLVKLQHLESFLSRRNEIAGIYTKELSGLVSVPAAEQSRLHTFHQYCIETENRDQLAAHLDQSGIATAIYYPVPLHLQAAFSYLGYKKGDFPVSERAAERILALPISPALKNDQQSAVIQAIKDFIKKA